MEAASARMAARSQFDGFMEPPKSTLQRYIYSACDPTANFEPNLALSLEIADLINAKKAGAPREAAVTIVNFINNRNPNVSLLALALLDMCVKNCGYPFHLQISTKEFLNELVRRFPERPPLRPTRVQNKILEAIEEWRQTICQTSKYKDDLGFIRDMHRLLLYKGYMFPEVRREDAAVLNPSDNLKSAEEMEEEERAAQSAKLQELIRRGGPEDLQEANRLMKVMAGYDTRHKTDYRAKAAEEVAKVQQKARLLEEMLQRHKAGDKMGEGDVFEELANALQSAHPKIQKMCEEESDDSEAVAKLLEINDSIHRTVERYKLMKAGDVEAATKIPKGTLGTTTGVGKNAANELSLIDFDPEPMGAAAAAATPGSLLQMPTGHGQQKSVEDDLLGLSMDDAFGQPGGISLGAGASGSALLSSPTPQISNQASMFSASSSNPPVTKPNYDAFAALTSSLPTSKPATPTPFTQQQRQADSQSKSATDPFASLISRGSRPSTPSRHPNGAGATPASFSLLNPSQAAPAPHRTQQIAAGPEEEWDFASSLPEPAQPTTNSVQVCLSSIAIDFIASRPIGQQQIHITAQFSNQGLQNITGLHFQVAVEKSYSLQLRPQTGRNLGPRQKNAIQQEILLSGVPPGKGSAVKMRFKIAFQLDGQPHEEQGNVPPLGVA